MKCCQGEGLRTNSPEVQVTGRQKLQTQIICLTLQTSSQKKSFLATPNVENKFEVLMMKYYLCLLAQFL